LGSDPIAKIEVAGGYTVAQVTEICGICVKTEDFANFHIPEFWDLQAVLAYFP